MPGQSPPAQVAQLQRRSQFKSIGLDAAVALGAFSAAFTVGNLLLGYRSGASVTVFGGAAPSLDAEAFNQIFSSAIAIAVALFVRWYRTAGEKQQQQAQTVIRLADAAYDAVFRGLAEAGIYRRPPPPSQPAPFPAATDEALLRHLDVIEASLAAIKSKLLSEI